MIKLIRLFRNRSFLDKWHFYMWCHENQHTMCQKCGKINDGWRDDKSKYKVDGWGYKIHG